MKKIISEEIKNMRYLFGYKRGVVISEQDEDNSVDPKLMSNTEKPAEPTQTTTQPAAGTTTTTTGTGTPPPSETPATVSPIKMGVKYPSIETLQNLLNTKFQSGLTRDGKYGPKTAASVLSALQSLKNQENISATSTSTEDASTAATKTATASTEPKPENKQNTSTGEENKQVAFSSKPVTDDEFETT